MSTVQTRLVTDAILEMLNTTPVLIGDGAPPHGGGWVNTRFTPYANLHHIAGGITDGPVTGPDDDAELIYQITAVGSTREQCEWVADVTRTAMLAAVETITILGREVLNIGVDMLGGSRRDDSLGPAEPAVWMGVDRFRVVTTPAF